MNLVLVLSSENQLFTVALEARTCDDYSVVYDGGGPSLALDSVLSMRWWCIRVGDGDLTEVTGERNRTTLSTLRASTVEPADGGGPNDEDGLSSSTVDARYPVPSVETPDSPAPSSCKDASGGTSIRIAGGSGGKAVSET